MNQLGRFVGINPQHPAARGIQLAMLALPGSGKAIDFVQGNIFAPATGVMATSIPFLGLSNRFTAASSRMSITRNNTALVQQQTYGAVLQLASGSLAALQQMFADSNGALIPGITVTTGAMQITRSGIGTTTSAVALSEVVPYFIGFSFDGTPASGSRILEFISRRMDTGVVATDHISNSTFSVTASAANTFIGCGASAGTNPLLGSIAMMAHSFCYMPQAALCEWAQDPWAIFARQDVTIPRRIGLAAVSGGGGPIVNGGQLINGGALVRGRLAA